jgi:hypothetical protein
MGFAQGIAVIHKIGVKPPMHPAPSSRHSGAGQLSSGASKQ